MHEIDANPQIQNLDRLDILQQAHLSSSKIIREVNKIINSNLNITILQEKKLNCERFSIDDYIIKFRDDL
jgi:hypothetical protein